MLLHLTRNKNSAFSLQKGASDAIIIRELVSSQKKDFM
nr:MAG TPA: hypothetical protein [Caudoviricetes sp.]